MSVDVTNAVNGLHELEQKQIPFALASTLTKLAKGGQVAVQSLLDSKFVLRNDFTKSGIRFKPAEKNSSRIEADVHTDTANRKTGAPDYLGKQQDGSERVAFGGHTHIAIPTKYLRQMIGQSPIPAELRPKALLSAVNGRYTSRNRKGQIALKNQTTVRGMVFFTQTSKSGTPMIMGKYWTDRDAYPFYILTRHVVTRPRLSMDKTVEAYVKENFQQVWSEQWKSMYARGLRFK